MKKIYIINILCCALMSLFSCSEDSNSTLQNDLIKRTVAPLIVGEKIEFAYAAGSTDSKLQLLRVEASVAGAEGTDFEPYAWRTENGTDISSIVATDCKTDGCFSSAKIIDSKATTLRYYYVVPEEIRGKEVSFVFSSVTENGDESTYQTPVYHVAKMEMKKLITLSGDDNGARYFSIDDMKAYTKDEVSNGNLSPKIDFIYAYTAKKTVGNQSFDYKHAFFSPSAETFYPDNFSLPAGLEKNQTLMDKKLYVWDGQLKDDKNNNIFVDDLDLVSQTFDNSLDYVLDLKAEGSVFMKSSDGKCVAYIYINKLDNNKKNATIGIKKYKY